MTRRWHWSPFAASFTTRPPCVPRVHLTERMRDALVGRGWLDGDDSCALPWAAVATAP